MTDSTSVSLPNDENMSEWALMPVIWPDSTDIEVLNLHPRRYASYPSSYAPKTPETYLCVGLFAIKKLLSELNEIREMDRSDRWPGSDWPSDKAFEDAAVFIRQLPVSLVAVPNLGIADDGEVNFLWENSTAHIDLGFYGTGTYSVFAQGDGGKEYMEDELPVVGGLPMAIEKLITV